MTDLEAHHQTPAQVPARPTRAVSQAEFTWNKYRRLPMNCWAIRMNQEFEVKTLEGTLRGKPGDWLVKGDDGQEFPVPDAQFRRHYSDRR